MEQCILNSYEGRVIADLLSMSVINRSIYRRNERIPQLSQLYTGSLT